MLASPLCQDVPGLALVALEVLDLRFTRAEAGVWLERLMLIHAFERGRERRADDAETGAVLAALRRPGRRG